jgi:hypothetical protein
MNPTRKIKVDDIEAVLQARTRHEQLPVDEQIKEKLEDLQKFIGYLSQTAHGKTDLDLRVDLLGACQRTPNESDREFYGRLRRWLDRDLEAAIRLRSPA